MEEAEQIEQEIEKGTEDDRKTAEAYVLNYEAWNRTHEEFMNEAREDSVWGTPDAEVVGGKSNLPRNPVEKTGILLADYAMKSDHPLWLRAVELALKTFGERRRIFIKVRCEAEKANKDNGKVGRPGWVVYTQHRYREETQKRFLNDGTWVGESTLKLWWSDVLTRVVEIFLRLKLKKNNFV